MLSDVAGLPCDELEAVPYTLGLVPERYRAGFLGVAYATSALDFLLCGEGIAGVNVDGGESPIPLKNTSAAAEDGLLCFRNREGVPLVIEFPSG